MILLCVVAVSAQYVHACAHSCVVSVHAILHMVLVWRNKGGANASAAAAITSANDMYVLVFSACASPRNRWRPQQRGLGLAPRCGSSGAGVKQLSMHAFRAAEGSTGEHRSAPVAHPPHINMWWRGRS